MSGTPPLADRPPGGREALGPLGVELTVVTLEGSSDGAFVTIDDLRVAGSYVGG